MTSIMNFIGIVILAMTVFHIREKNLFLILMGFYLKFKFYLDFFS